MGTTVVGDTSNSEVKAPPTGYAHPDYARALSDVGTPRKLPRSGGWILERPVPGSNTADAMGCYPLFACRDWSALGGDLDALKGDLVSLALVADPFGDHTKELLEACFDVVKPFKEHVVVDLGRPAEEVVTKHHRKTAVRALKRMTVTRCDRPEDYSDQWVALYRHLVNTRNVSGVAAFSKRSLVLQLRVPGASLFVAQHEGKVVGAALSYQQGDVVYAHLTAFSDLGYKLGASYALKWKQMDYYSGQARWLDLGGVPGLDGAGNEGLRWYKQGWSGQTRAAYFCGCILDREEYAALAQAMSQPGNGYFPAYRVGEFG